MATIEYINKRIEGKEKEIDKLTKKLSRIEKAEATGWEVNPYYYSEYDKRHTIRDLDAAKEALEKYKAELQKETEKANSRNVEAILKFLENWKARMKEFYETSFPKYLKACEERDEANREYHEKTRYLSYKDPVRKELSEEHDKQYEAFCARWSFIFPYVTRVLNKDRTAYEEVLDIEKLVKDLKNEADAKYDDIIERTNKITGKITDATNLNVGAKGELNGYITGERGTAKVETIGAGGYNIQCYHFRTLIHKVA